MTDTVFVTKEDLQIDLVVTPAQWEGAFDSLEVWRSRTGPDGPYYNLTSDSWSTARLPDGAPDAPSVPATGPSVPLSGKTLLLKVNEDTDVSVVFTGGGILTFAQAATQITAQGLGLVRAYVVGALLVIETLGVGGAVTLRALSSDGAALLGLPTVLPASLAFGREARVRLASGTTSYQFTDHNGSPTYTYKTRFYNSATSATSDFSDPFTSTFLAGLDSSQTIRATVDLVDAEGNTLSNTPVLLTGKNHGTRINGKTVLGGSITVLTDVDGHAEFSLVRGQPFTVALAGTDIVRDFVTPTDPTVTTFDMLDPAYSSDDAFTVQKPNLNFAVRRST